MIHLIEGDDEYLMGLSAKTLARSSLGAEIHEYYWDDLSRFFANQSSLSDDLSVHIIFDAEGIPDCKTSNTIICVARESKSVNSSERADKKYFIAKPKVSGDKNEVVPWIIKEGHKRNNDLSRIAGALFVNTGLRLRKLMSEIDKISDLVSPGTVVSPEDVKPIIVFSAELTPKLIIDAVQEGRTAAALSYYDKLQEKADETGWIIAFLHRFVIQMNRIHIAKEAKKSDKQIAQILEVTDFVYTKFIEPYSGLWKPQSLQESVVRLARLDVQNKQGLADVTPELQTEIIRLAEEARNATRSK